MNNFFAHFLFADKQQELDLPSLRVDDSETEKARLSASGPRKSKDGGKDGFTLGGSVTSSSSSSGTVVALSAKSGATPASSSPSSSHVGRAMSHISGVKRPLSHSNSVTTSEKVAKYGVDTANEHELGKVPYITQPNARPSNHPFHPGRLIFIAVSGRSRPLGYRHFQNSGTVQQSTADGRDVRHFQSTCITL